MTFSEQAIEALHAGQLDKMTSLLEQAIKADQPEHLQDLAEYLSMMGFQEESRQLYEQLLDAGQVGTEGLFYLAEMAIDDGDDEQALDYLYRIQPEDEQYSAALLAIADIYEQTGFWEAGLEKLMQAKQYDDNVLIEFAIGELYFKNEQWLNAIAYYAKLNQREILAQTKVNTYERIGVAYAKAGEYEHALNFLEKALEIDHSDELLYDIALLYHQLGEHQTAINFFKQLATLDPDTLDFELSFGESYEAEKDFQSALEVAQAGLKKRPNQVALLHFASRMSYALHDPEAAERYLMQAMDLPEQHDETVFLLINLYQAEHDDEAIVHLAQSIEDQHSLAFWEIAKAHMRLDQADLASPYYEDLAEAMADNPEFLLDYAEHLHYLGKIRPALVTLARYLELVPDDMAAQARYQAMGLEL